MHAQVGWLYLRRRSPHIWHLTGRIYSSVIQSQAPQPCSRSWAPAEAFESILNNFPLPTYRALASERIEPTPILLPSISDSHEDDIAFIFHTSGSTSGSPKLVPMTYRWLSTTFLKLHHVSKPRDLHRQDVAVCMCVFFFLPQSPSKASGWSMFNRGSMCHIAQTFSEYQASDCRSAILIFII